MTDQIPEQKVLLIGASDESYRGLLDIIPVDKQWVDKAIPHGVSSSLTIQDLDIASLYTHCTTEVKGYPRVMPIRSYGESEIRPSMLASYGISYTRAALKARKLEKFQEQYVETVTDLLTAMTDTPVHLRRSVHKNIINEVKRELRGNPLYRPSRFDRTIDYDIESGDLGGVFLPIGLGVDCRVTNQQRQIARLAKEQFGKRWRHGLVNIYSLGE